LPLAKVAALLASYTLLTPVRLAVRALAATVMVRGVLLSTATA